ncbi:MAG TPA: hypothetical protein VNK95_02055 [Caldilineaceae bacterium]|nr:hypothetical protein [Caldilineaceae bacterium]
MRQLAAFTLYPQEAPNWRWPAIIQMLQHHFWADCQSQAEIAAQCTNSGCAPTASDSAGLSPLTGCAAACLQGLRWQATRRNRPLAWETFCQEIEVNRPVVICWGEHSCICVGYEALSRHLLVFNPLPVGRGRLETLSYYDYTELFDVQSLYAIQPVASRRLQAPALS